MGAVTELGVVVMIVQLLSEPPSGSWDARQRAAFQRRVSEIGASAPVP